MSAVIKYRRVFSLPDFFPSPILTIMSFQHRSRFSFRVPIAIVFFGREFYLKKRMRQVKSTTPTGLEIRRRPVFLRKFRQVAVLQVSIRDFRKVFHGGRGGLSVALHLPHHLALFFFFLKMSLQPISCSFTVLSFRLHSHRNPLAHSSYIPIGGNQV